MGMEVRNPWFSPAILEANQSWLCQICLLYNYDDDESVDIIRIANSLYCRVLTQCRIDEKYSSLFCLTSFWIAAKYVLHSHHVPRLRALYKLGSTKYKVEQFVQAEETILRLVNWHINLHPRKTA